jgi:hydrogenase expression/formation protein HypC
MCLAVPGRIVETTTDDGLNRIARVQFGGIKRPVCLDFLPDPKPGYYTGANYTVIVARIAMGWQEGTRRPPLVRTLDDRLALNQRTSIGASG